MRKASAWVVIFLLTGTGIAPAAGPVGVRVPAGDEPAPQWAVQQLRWLDNLSKTYHTFLDRFVDGKMDCKPLAGLTVDGRCHRDWTRAVGTWDHYLLSRHDPRTQKAYVNFWHAIFRHENMPKVNPFWCVPNFKVSETSRFFHMLWQAIEIDPTDKKLIADNRRVIDFLMAEFYDPKLRLMTSASHRRGKPTYRGDVLLNTVWLNAALRAYLTTGERKYRRWALEYGTSWNQLAVANNGVFPAYVPPGTRRLDGKRFVTPWMWHGFDFVDFGITIGMGRPAHSLPATLCLLDEGDPKHVAGLAGTLDFLFAKGHDGLPAAKHDDDLAKGWFRDPRSGWGNWAVPRLVDRCYVLTFDPKIARRIKSYYAAAVRAPKAAEEELWFLRFLNFTYFGGESLEAVTKLFSEQADNRLKTLEKFKTGPVPKTGADLIRNYAIGLWGLDYIDGSFWGMWDNGRCGGTSVSSLRYFTAAGEPGLPKDVAALVRHVGKQSLVVLMHNRAATETALRVTAGWYGQHRFRSAAVNDAAAVKIDDRRVDLVLAPGATARLTFALDRFVNAPTLQPQEISR